MLQDPEHWIWDSWIADDGERYHLFFLKAPAALKDPALRHEAAFIGHASSTDLTHWTLHADALTPGDHGRWDDLALWTGSVARGEDGTWRMYYTALNTSRGHTVRDQQLGLAESKDLETWTRVGDLPLVAPDPAWYLTHEPGVSETWRDPFVFGAEGRWHMLITARDPVAPRLKDGILGHATSDDMVTWELQPPLTTPAGFGQLEVAATPARRRPVAARLHLPPGGAERGPAARVRGLLHVVRRRRLAARPVRPRPRASRSPPTRSCSPPRSSRRATAQWVFVGFRNTEPEGVLNFHIIDPLPLHG